MPIKGLTDRAKPSFAYLGKLRKGAARTAEDMVKNRPGQDLPYFRFTSDRTEVQKAFEEAYGDQPAMVHVFLPYAKVADNFQCWKEKWSQGGLEHRCDGETCSVWLGPDGKYHHEAKPCPGGCDEVGRLLCMVPELLSAGFVGYVTAETHGVNDILSVQSSLEAALEARGDNPDGLQGIPWVLRRQLVKISTPGKDGKRARREKPLLRIEPLADWVRLKLEASRQAAYGMPLLEAAKPEAKVEVVNPETGGIQPAVVEPPAEPPEPEEVEEAEIIEPESIPDAPPPTAAEPTDWQEADATLSDLCEGYGHSYAALVSWAEMHYQVSYKDLALNQLKELADKLHKKYRKGR
jgi:hypothetical protein